MSRLILVSNRLPVTVKLEKGQLAVTRSPGGLATGLAGPHERSGGLWIGWPGDVSRLTEPQRQDLSRQLEALRTVPLNLSASEVTRFYEGFSNRILWPLHHYMVDRMPRQTRDWGVYRSVNERFADLVAQHYQEGDHIWVQDYQLMLVPALLRQRLPSARIGFFLHIPFPASEVFRTLPWREQLLEGLLGADLVGFHTLSYVRHFANALVHILGVRTDVDRVHHAGRTIRLGAFPMGIDAESFAKLVALPEVRAEAASLRREGERLLLGVDRLDYTKGIPRRLLAVERLLERTPSWRGRLKLLQVAVPSRDKVDEYEKLRRDVNELVGRINGAHGTASQVPIHYLYRGFPVQRLAALYRAADVMLVTPLRDGMNLVAKEFVACRDDEDGVLVLSELAGAASELGEALPCNPYDVEGMAECIARALSMPEAERKDRMRALRGRVRAYDVHRWAKDFLDELAARPEVSAGPDTSPEALAALTARARKAPSLLLMLDYDGTLVDFTRKPEAAVPDAELKTLLAALCKRPNTYVHVVSGRRREDLERWLGELPLGLHCEHGMWSRQSAGAPWLPLRDVSLEFKKKVRPIFESYVARTVGSSIEEKSATIAWHYRGADREFAASQARELQLHLVHSFSNEPVEVLGGNHVVEVRPYGVNKGAVLPKLLQALKPSLTIAMGDDLTDEDLFRALPPEGMAVHVGNRQTQAKLQVADIAAARRFLQSLLPG